MPVDLPSTRGVPVGALGDRVDVARTQQHSQIVRQRHPRCAEVAEEADDRVVTRLRRIVAGHISDDWPVATDAERARRVPQRATRAQRWADHHVTGAGVAGVGEMGWIGLVQRHRLPLAAADGPTVLVPSRRENEHRVRPQRIRPRAVVVAPAVLLWVPALPAVDGGEAVVVAGPHGQHRTFSGPATPAILTTDSVLMLPATAKLAPPSSLRNTPPSLASQAVPA